MESTKSIALAEESTVSLPTSSTDRSPRLSIPLEYRLPAATVASFVTGAFLGATYGSQTAALRFRAENAHRLPDTSTGWYLYHKSKNYHMALGAVKEGLKMGSKISFWVGSYFAVEEAIDQVRGDRSDFLSSVVAGLSIAGGFSAWNRFPVVTAVRTARIGFLSGLAIGLVQDLVALGRGKTPFYVELLLGTKKRTASQLEH